MCYHRFFLMVLVLGPTNQHASVAADIPSQTSALLTHARHAEIKISKSFLGVIVARHVCAPHGGYSILRCYLLPMLPISISASFLIYFGKTASA